MHSVNRWHKRAKWLYNHKVPILPKLIHKMMRIIFACDLPFTSDIGENVGFFHNGLGVVIHRHAKIGSGSKIYQNVTIGGNGKNSEFNGVPVLGENVFVGCGAVITGPIIIGDNAKIGANSVVTKSVPPYAVVMGAPAQVIRIEETIDVSNYTSNDQSTSFRGRI